MLKKKFNFQAVTSGLIEDEFDVTQWEFTEWNINRNKGLFALGRNKFLNY